MKNIRNDSSSTTVNIYTPTTENNIENIVSIPYSTQTIDVTLTPNTGTSYEYSYKLEKLNNLVTLTFPKFDTSMTTTDVRYFDFINAGGILASFPAEYRPTEELVYAFPRKKGNTPGAFIYEVDVIGLIIIPRVGDASSYIRFRAGDSSIQYWQPNNQCWSANSVTYSVSL